MIESNRMTAGSPAKHILKLAFPLMFGNIFQQLYNMVDSIVVGNYVGASALTAVGTGFPVVFLLASLFIAAQFLSGLHDRRWFEYRKNLPLA